MAEIRVQNLQKRFGDFLAVRDSTFTIPDGSFFCLLGPSGCGKSTLLRCLNRMNDLIDGARVTAGAIRIHGIDIHRPDVDVIELRKRVGMVFQKSNPFPKSIFDNVAYGLRINGLAASKSETAGRVEDRPAPDHVVADDEPALPDEPEAPFEVGRHVRLVGVDEGEVEGAGEGRQDKRRHACTEGHAARIDGRSGW